MNLSKVIIGVFIGAAGFHLFGPEKIKTVVETETIVEKIEIITINEQYESIKANIKETIIDDKINTRDEWVDMFQVLMSHSEEIQGLNDSQIKSLLQQSLKDM